MKRAIVNISCLAASLLLALVVCEVFLRTFKPVEFRRPPSSFGVRPIQELTHRKSQVPGLSYELTPNAEAEVLGVLVKINSKGMRDDEPTAIDQEQMLRIAVVGDSHTFGFAVRGEQSYPQVLEKRLRGRFSEQTKNIEVLNFGVAGYSTKEEALLFEHRVLDWRPDLIVIAYSLNDPEIEPVQPLHSFFAAVEWWQHSHFLRAVAYARFRLSTWWFGDGDYTIALHKHPEKWQSVVDGLGRIAELAREREVPVLLMIIPHLPKIYQKPYPYEGIHAQLGKLGREHDFVVLDLYQTFNREKAEDVRFSEFEIHTTAYGRGLSLELWSKQFCVCRGCGEHQGCVQAVEN